MKVYANSYKGRRLPAGMSITELDNGDVIASLYATDIVKVCGGTTTLNAGSWYTCHTKKCMNVAFELLSIPAHVYQAKNVWYVTHDGTELEFHDGMTLNI